MSPPSPIALPSVGLSVASVRGSAGRFTPVCHSVPKDPSLGFASRKRGGGEKERRARPLCRWDTYIWHWRKLRRKKGGKIEDSHRLRWDHYRFLTCLRNEVPQHAWNDTPRRVDQDPARHDVPSRHTSLAGQQKRLGASHHHRPRDTQNLKGCLHRFHTNPSKSFFCSPFQIAK